MNICNTINIKRYSQRKKSKLGKFKDHNVPSEITKKK